MPKKINSTDVFFRRNSIFGKDLPKKINSTDVFFRRNSISGKHFC